MNRAVGFFIAGFFVGTGITYYLKQLENSSESGVYPAADCGLLSKFVQKKLGFLQYITLAVFWVAFQGTTDPVCDAEKTSG